MGHILKLKPVFKEMIWGGKKLRDIYGYDIPSDKTGECWAISAHKNGDCIIDGGEFNGISLSSLYCSHRHLFGNITNNEFPLLVKIIDANLDLSVQVHPNDEYAIKHENSLGKAECWYVLDANDDTSMVMGHNAKNKESLIQSIQNNDYDNLLNRLKITKGDFYNIETGTIHAICAGSLIYEAQQSSDITYRVYDYQRTDDNGNQRELHVQQSIDVTNVPYIDNTDTFRVIDDNCTMLTKTSYFTLFKYVIDDTYIIDNHNPFMMVSVISGNGTINGDEVVMGSHCLVCSDQKEIELKGNMEVMICTL